MRAFAATHGARPDAEIARPVQLVTLDELLEGGVADPRGAMSWVEVRYAIR
jgi:hypothetical protein